MIVAIYILALILALSIIYYTLKLGISPMPSNAIVTKNILRLLRELESANNINSHTRIAELGAGWGSLVFAIARQYPQAVVTAYERSFVPWLILRIRRLLWVQPNLIIKRLDFLEQDLGHQQLFICYLYPGGMTKLADKIKIDKLSGLLITHTFALPLTKETHVEADGQTNVELIKKLQANDLHQTPIYVYNLLANNQKDNYKK